MNIFRLPLNTVVVAGTYAMDVLPAYQVYMIVSACFMAAVFLQATMINFDGSTSTNKAAAKAKVGSSDKKKKKNFRRVSLVVDNHITDHY